VGGQCAPARLARAWLRAWRAFRDRASRGEAKPERFPNLAAELVRLQVDVIVAGGPMLPALKELVPGAAPVAVLRERANLLSWQAAESAARERGWKLLSLEIRDAGEIDGAFKAATRARGIPSQKSGAHEPMRSRCCRTRSWSHCAGRSRDWQRATEYPRSTPYVSSSRMAASFHTPRTSMTSGGARRAMSIRFSAVRGLATSRSSNRPRSSYGSI
jgi:hypothetical protein